MRKRKKNEKPKRKVVWHTEFTNFIEKDQLAAESERIDKLKAENPDNWRQILMNEVREKISKQQEVKPKKIIDKEQIKRDIRALRLKDKPDEYKDIDVFDCMPSPENTLEYQKYLKVLREYQDAIPEQALPVTGKR